MAQHALESAPALQATPCSPDAESEWVSWWQSNTYDMNAIMESTRLLGVDRKLECLAMARSTKVYERLVVYAYVHLSIDVELIPLNIQFSPSCLEQLRVTSKSWESWDECQALSKHHIVRETIWRIFPVPLEQHIRGCDLQFLLDCDIYAIRTKLLEVLSDSQRKKGFLDTCVGDPIPTLNLLQMLLDCASPSDGGRPLLSRAITRLSKSSACLPDCLILHGIQPAGKDPVAGGGFADVWKGNLPLKPPKPMRRALRDQNCGFCGGNDSKNAKGEPESMVSCVACGRSGHPSCMAIPEALGDILRSNPWKCIECKDCEVCKVRRPDDIVQMLTCDICDKGWHMKCLNPPLENPRIGKWFCPRCMDSLPFGILPSPNAMNHDEKCIPVALKALRVYNKSDKEKALKTFSHEAVIWRQLRHPNILPFYGVFRGDENFERLCLVSPWMDLGNAITYLTAHPYADRLALLSDVAKGMEYLHHYVPPIIHGDLKGGNILVTPSLTACLGDFGLAQFRDSQESTLGNTTGATTGTLRWQAPELFRRDNNGSIPRPNQQSDCYSFGCVCLELMTGRPPFMEIRNDLAVMTALIHNETPQRPQEDLSERGLDNSLWAVIEHCWETNPHHRPTASDLVKHFHAHNKTSSPIVTTNSEFPNDLLAGLGQYGFPDDDVAHISETANPAIRKAAGQSRLEPPAHFSCISCRRARVPCKLGNPSCDTSEVKRTICT
ncbi:kinase-like protein [Rickenella mellea]|uniref:Kinase-like protein n=1 Tax=Rickenella mellea TaxID=50990 RepID=A0A4Y7Q2M3_9AGAM|nr:kinase-like protein [Rickenella mellea]